MSSTNVPANHASDTYSSANGKRNRINPGIFAAVLLATVSLALVWVTPALATTPSIPTALVRHQQTEPRLAYSGAWHTSFNPAASGGSFAFADTSGASVTVRFMGTHLYWIAKKGPLYGKAEVKLDGTVVGTVDLYSATTKWQQRVWGTGALAAGPHTVTISWTGEKNNTAQGTYINMDAFDVSGVLTGIYQQSNAKLDYGGAWKTTANASASGGSFVYADSSGASITIHFSGIELVWIAKKGPLYGDAKVALDGGSPVSVDLYSSTALWRQQVWSTGILTNGSHTVKISWTGAKPTGATGAYINADAFEIVGTLE